MPPTSEAAAFPHETETCLSRPGFNPPRARGLPIYEKIEQQTELGNILKAVHS